MQTISLELHKYFGFIRLVRFAANLTNSSWICAFFRKNGNWDFWIARFCHVGSPVASPVVLCPQQTSLRYFCCMAGRRYTQIGFDYHKTQCCISKRPSIVNPFNICSYVLMVAGYSWCEQGSKMLGHGPRPCAANTNPDKLSDLSCI